MMFPDLNLAQTYINTGNYHSAIEELKNVLGEEPEFADAHALLALALNDTKRVIAARAEINIALSIEADNDYFHYVDSVIAQNEGRLEEAFSAIERSLNLNSNEPLYYVRLSELYIKKGKIKRAKVILHEVLEFSPNYIEALNLKAGILFKERKVNESERVILRSLEQDSLNQEALIIHGEILLYKGDSTAARDNAIEVLKQDSENVGALNLLMSCKFKKNPLTGIWWRFNSFMQRLTSTKQVIYLLMMYVIYRLTVFALMDTGYNDYTNYVSYAWIAFVLYTWISPAIFNGLLKKDLKKIELDNF